MLWFKDHMANSKTKAPRGVKKPATSKKAEKKTKVLPVRKMADIRNRQPALTETQRAAYLSNATDAVCEERGRATKGAGVRAEAVAWIIKMDADMSGPNRDSIPYSPARFRFFIECVGDLTDALSQQNAERNKAQGDKTLLATRLEEAAVADKSIEQALARVAGRRPAERRELDEASGAAATPEEKVVRTRRLVELGGKWLASKDPQIQVLVADAELTEQVIQNADEAASLLDDARSGARATRIDPRDKPAVNRAEGRVLFEMEFAMDRWNEAHDKNARITRLNPGPATRAALKGRSKPKATKEKTPGAKANENKGDGKKAPKGEDSQTP